MSDPTPEPLPVPAPPHRAAPTPTGLVRATAIVATVGVVVALLGLLLLLRPVSSPVQDCGTVAGFLLDGRVDVYADPTDPPDGLTAAEVEAANARPCRARVADAARPGAMALVAGVVVAVGALGTEATSRGVAWWKRRSGPPLADGPEGAHDDRPRADVGAGPDRS